MRYLPMRFLSTKVFGSQFSVCVLLLSLVVASTGSATNAISLKKSFIREAVATENTSMMADATADGKYVFFGCSPTYFAGYPYPFSRLGTCVHIERELEIYDVDKKTTRTVLLPISYRNPHTSYDTTSYYDVYGHTLVMSSNPDGKVDETQGVIFTVDLTTGQVQTLWTLPKGSVCSQIRALPTGVLCSVSAFKSLSESVETLSFFEYASGKTTLAKDISVQSIFSGTTVFPSLGSQDAESPAFAVMKYHRTGHPITGQSFLYDPPTGQFHYLTQYGSRMYYEGYARGSFNPGKGPVYTYEVRWTEYDEALKRHFGRSQAVLFNSKTGFQTFDIPRLPQTREPYLSFELLGAFLSPRTEPQLLIGPVDEPYTFMKRDILAINTVSGQQTPVRAFDHSGHMKWLSQLGRLIGMTCKPNVKPASCVWESYDPQTKVLQTAAIPPLDGTTIVKPSLPTEKVFFSDERNSYVYDPAKNKVHLVLDRPAAEGVGPFDGSRLITKDKVLIWTERLVDRKGEVELLLVTLP